MKSYSLFGIVVGCLLSYSYPIQAQQGDSNARFEQADEPPGYPGGIQEFYRYVSENLKYPPEASLRKIEGRVFVEFVVSETGEIDPGSVKVVKGIDPDCDLEAKRAILSNKTKWKPARKNNKAIPNLMVLPITFKIDRKPGRYDSLHINPIVTTVAKKVTSRQNSNWLVYANRNMTNPIAELPEGKLVNVVGWGPWVFAIKTDSLLGYIPYKGLDINAALSDLATFLENESETIEKMTIRADSIRTSYLRNYWSGSLSLHDITYRRAERLYDSMQFAKGELVFLRVIASKEKIVAGECAILDVSLVVHNESIERLQFDQLGIQISNWYKNKVDINNCWISVNPVSEIVGANKSITHHKYTEYMVSEAAFCPTQPGKMYIRPMTLEMAQLQSIPNGKFEKMVSYTSKPLTITVNALPTNIKNTEADLYRMIGSYITSDTLYVRPGFTPSFIYEFTIKGTGLTFPLEAPSWNDEVAEYELFDIHHQDTIMDYRYFSSKTFKYRVKPQQLGESNHFTKPVYRTYDLINNKAVDVIGGPVVEIKKLNKIKFDSPFHKNSNLIALDVSKSMKLEDLLPDRLGVALEGIKGFYREREKCDVGLIVFGGEAKQVTANGSENCIQEITLRQVDHTMLQEGTAIGDAIWFSANMSMTKQNQPKSMVIIGDGDNTGGIMTVSMAITLAKKYGIKIFTIGVGTFGPVTLGNDFFGKPVTVTDTFFESDLKKIAESTGGKYFHAKNAEEIKEILLDVLK